MNNKQQLTQADFKIWKKKKLNYPWSQINLNVPSVDLFFLECYMLSLSSAEAVNTLTSVCSVVRFCSPPLPQDKL